MQGESNSVEKLDETRNLSWVIRTGGVAKKIVFISVLEAKASRARGHSGHEAPPMTHSLVLTPPL